MAFLGCAVGSGFLRFRVQEIKKGPRGPMHTARIWMASATPGGAPGYDYDKEIGNNVAHSTARTSQRLRGYTARSPEVKGRTTLARFWQCNGVPAFRRGGICGSRYATGGPTSFVARMSEATSGAGGW